jgi:hypothetical protein
MIGRTGRAGLPLLCAAEERAGERRRVTKNCDRHTSRPSLQLSPRSFLVGRECQIKPVHGLGNLTSLRPHSTGYQTKLVLGRVGRGAQTGDRHPINGASSHRDGTPQSRRLRRQFIRRIRSERGTTAVVHPNAQNQKNSGVPAGMTTWWVSVVVPGAPARNRTWLAGPLQMPGSTSHSR